MDRCARCGQPLPEAAERFCVYCGAEIEPPRPGYIWPLVAVGGVGALLVVAIVFFMVRQENTGYTASPDTYEPETSAQSFQTPTYSTRSTTQTSSETWDTSEATPTEPLDGAPAWPGVVYAYGDCAPELKTFQLRMNVYGYGFDGTGCYFDKTRTAVLELQRANGIEDSGLLDRETWEAAWSGEAPR
jgi:hypothetical protein